MYSNNFLSSRHAARITVWIWRIIQPNNCLSSSSAGKQTKMDVIVSEQYMSNWDKISWMCSEFHVYFLKTKGQSNMDNTEKLTTQGTQYEKKHNTICVRHRYTETNTINVNKTWALLQTTGGKDEPNIVFNAEIVTDITTRNSERTDTSLHNTRKAQIYEQHGPHQKNGDELSCSVPASYKTPAVLLIYTVKFSKILGSDRGKKTST